MKRITRSRLEFLISCSEPARDEDDAGVIGSGSKTRRLPFIFSLNIVARCALFDYAA